MKNQAPPTDQALVAEYLSCGGAITVCPPHTFAVDATRSLTHKEKLAEWRRIASRHFAGLRAKQKRDRAEDRAPRESQPSPDVAARRAEILRLVQQGVAPAAIADRLGMTTSHVSLDLSRMRRAGLDLPRFQGGHAARSRPAKPAVWSAASPADAAQLVALWGEGWTTGQLGRAFGVTPQVIHDRVKALRRRGHELASRSTAHRGPEGAPVLSRAGGAA